MLAVQGALQATVCEVAPRMGHQSSARSLSVAPDELSRRLEAKLARA
jgi:hypothetical protein